MLLAAALRPASVAAQHTIAALDPIETSRRDTADADELLLTRTSITGIVRGATGLPLENTEVCVRGRGLLDQGAAPGPAAHASDGTRVAVTVVWS